MLRSVFALAGLILAGPAFAADLSYPTPPTQSPVYAPISAYNSTPVSVDSHTVMVGLAYKF